MPSSVQSLLFAGACLLTTAFSATIDTQLVGTWSTKSGKVFTGPGFYNPVNDSFIEPSLTGISYSFTSDGYYEEAYYRAVAEPKDPSCPQAVMQWQHGTVVMNDDLSLSLTPFAVDGRELTSNPCSSSKKATYMRYNQSETFEKWQVYTDGYTKLTRLDLYEFDGTPMNPLFLAYSPPLMLPTITMNPTTSAATATATSKVKRSTGEEQEIEVEYSLPLNKNVKHIKRDMPEQSSLDLNLLWWAGVSMCVFGGAAYLL